MKHIRNWGIAIGIAALALILPQTRMVMVMVLPIGVKPDDIVVWLLIIAFVVWWFVRKARAKLKELHSLGVFDSDAERQVKERAEHIKTSRQAVRVFTEEMCGVSSISPLCDAAHLLADNLSELLKLADEEMWECDSKLRKLSTYYTQTAQKVYRTYLKYPELKDKTRKLLDDISTAVSLMCDKINQHIVYDTELDLFVVNKELFKDFNI